MRIATVAGLLTALSLGTPALAQPSGTMTGNQLLDACGPEIAPTTATSMQGLCVGYVEGAYEALNISGQETFCIRPDVTVGQITAIVIKALREYPQVRDKPAPVIIAVSIKNAFPC